MNFPDVIDGYFIVKRIAEGNCPSGVNPYDYLVAIVLNDLGSREVAVFIRRIENFDGHSFCYSDDLYEWHRSDFGTDGHPSSIYSRIAGITRALSSCGGVIGTYKVYDPGPYEDYVNKTKAERYKIRI